ncbi:hypothetical protein O7632_16515 [Solwaraspora sp. WMMD406]|uniref:hypothetical protein n=1 Tax=Solwaraspora sp. WMMD406 TaxID=3016095 RepID=UPI002415AF0D|nr:hypothetical protein [Solwaraspora sp. WMMD406]MDG4765688.1 hypothetical protein [Solwaraspora sp. WMMD406]
MELAVIADRSAIDAATQATVEQPVIRPRTRSATSGQDTSGFDEPTAEQPVLRPRSAPPLRPADGPTGPDPTRPREGLRVAPWVNGSGDAATVEFGGAVGDGTDGGAAGGTDDVAAEHRAPDAPAPASTPQPPRAPVDEPDRFLDVARRYGWLVAAGGVAAVVLLCSAPFVSGSGLLWSPADSSDVLTPVSPSAPDDATAAPPTPTPSPTPTVDAPASGVGSDGGQVPADQPRTAPAPSTPATSAAPTPVATTPAAPVEPVLLGPASNEELYPILDGYCKDEYGWQSMARLRDWPGPAQDNWRCTRRGEDPVIDVARACARRYGGEVTAAALDDRDAFSWRCYRR